ncbi:type III secretion system inner rod subunit SctI [Chitinimonas sp. PSY-7]|uniref:type III secretion system inner rod subunit SctI n=1 Tax=Chitinimonas sp. PSY-7 TaxID=3459088 RepID=UPI004040070E
MNLDPIHQAALPTINPTEAVQAPDETMQAKFAALMQPGVAATDPVELLKAQSQLGNIAVGTDLTAKAVGALTQAINKLVNMS